MNIKCKICNSTKIFQIGINTTLSKNDLNVYRCKQCGTGFIHPSQTEKQLSEFYSSYDFDNDLKDSLYIHKIALSYLSRLHSNIRAYDRSLYIKDICKVPGKFLEIGGARGELLNEMKKKKWLVSGIELSEEFIRYCKERYNIAMHKGLSEYKNEKFDVIALFHVLEHIINPISELKNLKKYLSKEGIIVVEVPHLPNNLDYILPKENRKFIDSHTFHFTPESFRIIAEAGGLKIISLERIINRQLFKSASLYDLFPNKHKYSPVSSVKSALNAAYILILNTLKQKTTKRIENWENIDYAGHGDFIRVALTTK